VIASPLRLVPECVLNLEEPSASRVREQPGLELGDRRPALCEVIHGRRQALAMLVKPVCEIELLVGLHDWLAL